MDLSQYFENFLIRPYSSSRDVDIRKRIDLNTKNCENVDDAFSLFAIYIRLFFIFTSYLLRIIIQLLGSRDVGESQL